MKRRSTWLLVPAIMIAVALFVAGLRARVADRIRRTHMLFLFTQCREAMAQTNFPETEAHFLELVSQSELDWNSCRLIDGRMLDGWGNPVRIDLDSRRQSLILASCGLDGSWGTDDDIQSVITGKPISPPD